MKKIYISGPVQDKNLGLGNYGSEEFRMQIIAKELARLLTESGLVKAYTNKSEMDLWKIVRDSNSKNVDFHLAIHSDAGPITAEGTTSIYHKGSNLGKKYAQIIYDYIAPKSAGKDRGVVPDTNYTNTGFYELKKTQAPAVLVELGFHTNPVESQWIIDEPEEIAKGLFNAVMKIFDLVIPEVISDYEIAVEFLVSKGVLSDKKYWRELDSRGAMSVSYVKNIITKIWREFDGKL